MRFVFVCRVVGSIVILFVLFLFVAENTKDNLRTDPPADARPLLLPRRASAEAARELVAFLLPGDEIDLSTQQHMRAHTSRSICEHITHNIAKNMRAHYSLTSLTTHSLSRRILTCDLFFEWSGPVRFVFVCGVVGSIAICFCLSRGRVPCDSFFVWSGPLRGLFVCRVVSICFVCRVCFVAMCVCLSLGPKHITHNITHNLTHNIARHMQAHYSLTSLTTSRDHDGDPTLRSNIARHMQSNIAIRCRLRTLHKQTHQL